MWLVYAQISAGQILSRPSTNQRGLFPDTFLWCDVTFPVTQQGQHLTKDMRAASTPPASPRTPKPRQQIRTVLINDVNG